MMMVVVPIVPVSTIFTAVGAMAITATMMMTRAGLSDWQHHQSGHTGKHQKLGKPGDFLKDANFVF